MQDGIAFRHRFRYDPDEWPDCQGFRLSIESTFPTVAAWLNGRPLDVPPGPKPEITVAQRAVRKGSNVLAIAVSHDEPPARPADDEDRTRREQIAVSPLAAGLEPRRGDQILTREQLADLGMFRALDRMPRVEEFPGSVVLRHFQPGDVACLQGETGNSAFYVLSAEDELHMKKVQLKFVTEELRDVRRKELEEFGPHQLLELLEVRKDELQALEARRKRSRQEARDPALKQREDSVRKEIAQLSWVAPAARRVIERAGTRPRDAVRKAATVWILPGPMRKPRPRGGLGRIAGRLWGGQSLAAGRSPETIPAGGATNVDLQTRRGEIYEGDLFGEMSCLTMAPRAATVVADREIFVLEFLRNVFQLLQKDEGYRQKTLDTYRQHALSGHLQRLEFLKGLDVEVLDRLGQVVDLKIVDAGTIICNEGEPADCVYLIRAGLVQVVKGAQGLRPALTEDDVPDWTALARAILRGDPGILVACPRCGNELRLPDRSLLGRHGRCPACRHKFRLEVQPAGGGEAGAADARGTLPPKIAAKVAAARESILSRNPASPGSASESRRVAAAGKKPGPPGKRPTRRETSPAEAVWHELPADVREAVRRLALKTSRPDDAMTVLVGLNELIKSTEFVDLKSLASLLKNEPRIAGFPLRHRDWSGQQVCIAGRLLLQAAYSEHLRPPADADETASMRILAYLSAGEVFGETGVLAGMRRTATCIAWDHPSTNSTRTPGKVELLILKAADFQRLVSESDELTRRVETARRRYRENQEREDARPVWARSSSIATSSEFQERGFIQGQKLMLIDLDACTRCGDCVRACIGAHDDGHSRLFLDGPRFDRFLVPSACRNCIDPACMLACPVGSIQKGENDQIVIRDWCIGCGKCASQCPYDSIQMHDTGLVPAEGADWRFMPLARVGRKRWYRSRYRDGDWSEFRGPLLWTLDFRDGLSRHLDGDLLEPLANRKYREQLLSVRLDVDRKPPMPPGMEETDVKVRLKVLPSMAVVCDQCSDLPGRQPACVEQCPHEAAMRVDVRREFPVAAGGNGATSA